MFRSSAFRRWTREHILWRTRIQVNEDKKLRAGRNGLPLPETTTFDGLQIGFVACIVGSATCLSS